MARDTVAEIIRLYSKLYTRHRRVRADVKRAFGRIRVCRTSALGAHLKRCECGHVCSVEYNSCRHRSCPQCQGARKAGWLKKIAEQLLPCAHAHVIFTVPEELNVFWQDNRRVFAEILLLAAQETLKTLLSDPQHLGATPGIISVLHTWGRNLSIHPHVHCLVTSGGVDDDGVFCKPARSILLPNRMLMQVFRGKMREALIRGIRRKELEIPSGLTSAKCISLFNRLARSDWNTRVLESYTHGTSVAGYLAKYLGGNPISGRRIERCSDREVVFRYRDHRDGRQKQMRLTPVEFLRRWSEHVPPKGLRTIRRCGLYANSCGPVREQVRQQLQDSSAVEAAAASTEAQRVSALEPERCPLCNAEVALRVIARPLKRPMIPKSPAICLTRPP
ncbi:IS91 family transposase [Pyruvatibacter sp.]